MWWVGQSPNHHIYGFLSGTKVLSSRSYSGLAHLARPTRTCSLATSSPWELDRPISASEQEALARPARVDPRGR
jgi:hypothetical protein